MVAFRVMICCTAMLCFLNLTSLAKTTPETFKPVDTLIENAILDHAFASASLAIVKDSGVIYHNAYGKFTYDENATKTSLNTLYDVASLTKALATTLSLMKLYEKGLFKLSDPVSKYFPSFSKHEKSGITIRQLMLHQSGLVPFRAYRTFCQTKTDLLQAIFADTCMTIPGTKTIYSDLNFILLGELVDTLSGKPLDVFFSDEIAKPLNLKTIFFNPADSVLKRIAPTEHDETWPFKRKRPLVHDPNAALMGGVAGHAGLFSTSRDIATLIIMLLNDGAIDDKLFLKPETIALFTARDPKLKKRALGWDLKSYGGKSSAGKYLSLKSFGHLGFTGTSIWIDTQRRLGIVFLTNRVYPSSTNKKIRRIRRELHSAIIECLETNPKPTP